MIPLSIFEKILVTFLMNENSLVLYFDANYFDEILTYVEVATDIAILITCFKNLLFFKIFQNINQNCFQNFYDLCFQKNEEAN